MSEVAKKTSVVKILVHREEYPNPRKALFWREKWAGDGVPNSTVTNMATLPSHVHGSYKVDDAPRDCVICPSELPKVENNYAI